MQKKLIVLRAEHGLTQKNVAKIIGIEESAYSRRENGIIQFKHNEMFRIARHFKKPMEDIFLETNCTLRAIDE